MVELMMVVSIATVVESLNSVAVAAVSGAKGRLPDAYIVGAYFAAGISLPGETEGGLIDGGYFVYYPHLKQRAFYLFGGGEVSGDFNPLKEAGHHPEAGVFEMWDWGFPGFQQESFNFFKPLLGGVDVKGSLYGGEWNGSGEQALLFGVSSSKSVSWFGIGSEKTQLRSVQDETVGAMATEVAIDHTLISGLETQNTFSGLNVIGQILGAGLNAGASAYWVNHGYGQ